MTVNGLFQIGLYFAALLLLVKPLGGYMAVSYTHLTLPTILRV